ncbi:MAG: hypothetical protein D3924_15025 [Candidatus Electrothrix sp. AR4]|nr:hypothetical protein [Candidatus Electrothrix sp. AR4]
MKIDNYSHVVPVLFLIATDLAEGKHFQKIGKIHQCYTVYNYMFLKKTLGSIERDFCVDNDQVSCF